MELPIYEAAISQDLNSELKVDFVALVDKPAIEKNFLAFSEQQPMTFAIQEDRRIISGAAMLANVPIYRKDNEIGEYMVVFKPQTIMAICQKFFQLGYNSNFNLMHDPEMKVGDVTMFESFIVDKQRGIKPMKGFEDAQDGSWFISAKVNNDRVWQLIKEGKLKGFSVEGIFSMTKGINSYEQKLEKVYEILNGTNVIN